MVARSGRQQYSLKATQQAALLLLLMIFLVRKINLMHDDDYFAGDVDVTGDEIGGIENYCFGLKH